MEHQVPHDLGLDKAKEVAKHALDSYAEKFAEYNPSASWSSDTKASISFKVKGVSLKGAVLVHERSIGMELDVPFWARPFKGKAISLIEKEIKLWIAKAKAGEI